MRKVLNCLACHHCHSKSMTWWWMAALHTHFFQRPVRLMYSPRVTASSVFSNTSAVWMNRCLPHAALKATCPIKLFPPGILRDILSLNKDETVNVYSWFVFTGYALITSVTTLCPLICDNVFDKIVLKYLPWHCSHIVCVIVSDAWLYP